VTGPAHVVPDGVDGVRLVDHVRGHLAVVAARAVGPLIAAGGELIDGRAGRIAESVHAGDVLTVDDGQLADLATRRLVTAPSPGALAVVHEDADLVVVDKPAGQHVHPMGPYRGDTLVGALLWHAGARPDRPWSAWRPHPVHRLDRATSGLLVVAKRRSVHDAFQELLDARRVERTYHALVVGDVRGSQGTIDQPLGRDPERDYRRAVVPVADGGQEAVTHWRVLARHGDATLVEVTLDTGRTHQIRVHLAALGHPVVGDTLYATAGSGRGDSAPGIALRAVQLSFPHPVTGASVDLRTQEDAASPAPG
jgi:23S rRNA pseudouridine1911/1915/1917 synthase